MIKNAWNEDKNQELKQTRQIGFEDVLTAIEEDRLLYDGQHLLNPDSYPHQRMLVIEHQDYAYAVPYVLEPDGSRFLKTIFPSRVLTNHFLNKE